MARLTAQDKLAFANRGWEALEESVNRIADEAFIEGFNEGRGYDGLATTDE